MATMFGCSPTRSFNRPKSVASRFKERTRSARKQNLNTRSVLSLLSRPSQTSPKPPSPSFFSNTQPVPGTTWSMAGRHPSTGSLSAEMNRCAFSLSGGCISLLIELLFDGLPKFEVIDVAQDEDRFNNFAEGLQRSVEGMLFGVGVESPEDLRGGCLLEFDGCNESEKIVPVVFDDLGVDVAGRGDFGLCAIPALSDLEG